MSMKRLYFPSFLLIASFIPLSARAQMNPYQIGMQYCQMVQNGVSRNKAWNYVISSYANTSSFGVNRGDPYAPWSPTSTFGGAIGSGLASGIAMGMELRSMKGDIQRVINNNCPAGAAGGSGGALLAPEVSDKSHSSYCNWNPWEEGCKDSSTQKKEITTSCLKALQKYDCQYIKYLDANPHMIDWVKANPEMAKKEALRLRAVDASEIGKSKDNAKTKPSVKPEIKHSSNSSQADCLKAADYKGCMEYHQSN